MDTADKILNNLRRQCSRREYCTADVLKKAEKALDGDHQQAVKVLNVLVEEKYVDDRRYAAAFARDKSSIAGWGAVKIRYMLSMKGVAKDVIDAALDSIDSDKSASRLEKLMAAYEALVTGGVKSYMIDDRQLTRFDLPVLKKENGLALLEKYSEFELSNGEEVLDTLKIARRYEE